jgi:hypothetical protein
MTLDQIEAKAMSTKSEPIVCQACGTHTFTGHIHACIPDKRHRPDYGGLHSDDPNDCYACWFSEHIETCNGCRACVPYEWLEEA